MTNTSSPPAANEENSGRTVVIRTPAPTKRSSCGNGETLSTRQSACARSSRRCALCRARRDHHGATSSDDCGRCGAGPRRPGEVRRRCSVSRSVRGAEAGSDGAPACDRFGQCVEAAADSHVFWWWTDRRLRWLLLCQWRRDRQAERVHGRCVRSVMPPVGFFAHARATTQSSNSGTAGSGLPGRGGGAGRSACTIAPTTVRGYGTARAHPASCSHGDLADRRDAPYAHPPGAEPGKIGPSDRPFPQVRPAILPPPRDRIL